MSALRIEAFLFDKDGTLLDFQRTWGPWAARAVRELGGDRAEALAMDLGVDLVGGRVESHSVIVAGTLDDVAHALAPLIPPMPMDTLRAEILRLGQEATPVPVCNLPVLFDHFRAMGFRMGVATNDAEQVAQDQVAALGLASHFEAVLGYDSGFGGKPGPGMCLAFADQTGIAPDRIAMVGDSLHDLHAGRAAGMFTIGVETGPATAAELAAHADLVLPSIADIPGWYDAMR